MSKTFQLGDASNPIDLTISNGDIFIQSIYVDPETNETYDLIALLADLNS